MKSAKKLLPYAHGFILLSLFAYGFETSIFMNPVAIAFFVIFGLHLFVAKGGAKMIFPSIFILVNLFMFLALFSELREFETFNREALFMLLVGTLYFGLNIVTSFIMILANIEITQPKLNGVVE